MPNKARVFKKMLRITYVFSGAVWSPGGNHRVVFEHANRLAERGHNVNLVFPRVPQVSTLPPADASGLLPLKGAATRIRRLIQPSRPRWFHLNPLVKTLSPIQLSSRTIPIGDAVVATSWHVAHLVAGLPGQHGRPFYLVHHDEGRKYGRDAIDSTLALPMTKIVVSTSTKIALEHLGASDVVLVRNGIDSHLYRPIVNPEQREPGSLLMNWVNKDIKDPEMALAALELVRNQSRNISVTFFGVAKRERALPDWIKYVRNPSNDQLVKDLYNQSAILMCSSKLEGFGFPAAEGMACGCAVATTDCGGVSDSCEHEATALLSRVGDPAALANNLLRLISDDGLRLRLSKEGSRRAATLDWDHSVDELETLFRSPAR